MAKYRIGVDVGGTFTDIVVVDSESGAIMTGKTPSTPSDPAKGVLDAVRLLGIDAAEIEYFAHGTTVGTNALITRELPRVALVCTKGFRDVLEIGRGPRPDLWDAYQDIAPPYIPRRHRLEVAERLDYRGDVLEAVDLGAVDGIATLLKAEGIESVAVSLLHAYASGTHERQIGERLTKEVPDVHLSLSHEILPEIFEFERTSTTVINACLAPVVGKYLNALAERLSDDGFSGDVLVLHSGGGVMQARNASLLAARVAKSGPAAGAAAMASIAQRCGFSNAMGLDVGGTSSDISLMVDGDLRHSTETFVEYGYPILFPSVDVVTIGAGGGSVAWIDEGGSLRNGPQSQGASPGPACYLKGGDRATNTDAQLVLGRLSEDGFLGGRMVVDRQAAEEAIVADIGQPLGMNAVDAAASILRIASANMAAAMRLVSLKRGHDPREFALVAFGGAGPLHGAEVAAELGIPTVIVPRWPGITSALGCLTLDARHDVSRTFTVDALGADGSLLDHEFNALEKEVRSRLAAEGFSSDDIYVQRRVDMRYVGQWRSLTVDWLATGETIASVLERFHGEHQRAYAYSSPDQAVEIYGLRVVGRGTVTQPDLTRRSTEGRAASEAGSRKVYFNEVGDFVETTLYAHDAMPSGFRFVGPAVVEQMDSTVAVPPGWSARVDAEGNILLQARST